MVSGWCRCRRSRDLDGDAGLFAGLSDGGLGDVLAEVLCAAGDRPQPVVRAADEQHPVAFVDHEHCHGDDDAVGLRRFGSLKYSVRATLPACHHWSGQTTRERPRTRLKLECSSRTARRRRAGVDAAPARSGGRSEEMRVDEHFVVETVDRVVQRCVVEVDCDVFLLAQLLVVREDVVDFAAHGVADPFLKAALGDSCPSGSPSRTSTLVPLSPSLGVRDSLGCCSGMNSPA